MMIRDDFLNKVHAGEGEDNVLPACHVRTA